MRVYALVPSLYRLINDQIDELAKDIGMLDENLNKTDRKNDTLDKHMCSSSSLRTRAFASCLR